MRKHITGKGWELKLRKNLSLAKLAKGAKDDCQTEIPKSEIHTRGNSRRGAEAQR